GEHKRTHHAKARNARLIDAVLRTPRDPPHGGNHCSVERRPHRCCQKSVRYMHNYASNGSTNVQIVPLRVFTVLRLCSLSPELMMKPWPASAVLASRSIPTFCVNSTI